jgi:hypothetical protein
MAHVSHPNDGNTGPRRGPRISRLLRRACGAVRRCIVCGCTDDRPCIYQDIENTAGGPVTVEVPCYWIGVDLCSNPACLQSVTVSLGGENVHVFE